MSGIDQILCASPSAIVESYSIKVFPDLVELAIVRVRSGLEQIAVLQADDSFQSYADLPVRSRRLTQGA